MLETELETGPGGRTICDRAAAAFAAYRGGDRGGLDDLVAVMTPLMWHTVRAQRVPQSQAEDVVQTVWMNLLHGAEAVHDPQSIVKWLLTAARREAWRVARRTRQEQSRSVVDTGPADPADQQGDGPADRVAQRVAGPEELAVRAEARQQLWQHVNRLSDRCRELVRVIAFADRPDYAVIAESLGMPVGSIGPTRGRCLAKLRDALASDPHWFPGQGEKR